MARGFLSGAFWGVLVAVGGAGTLSVLSGGAEAPLGKPEAAAVEVPAGSEFNQSRDDDQANLPASEPVVTGAAAPRVTAPEPDDLSPLQSADTDPGSQPSASALQGGMSAPVAGQGSAPDVAARSDEPVTQGGQAGAPLAPQDEAELSISTEPAQPMAPPADLDETAFVDPEPDDAPAGVEQAEPDVATAPAPQVQSDAPASPMSPAVSEAEEAQPVSPAPSPADSAQEIEKTEIPAMPEGGEEELVIRVAPESAAPSETPPVEQETESQVVEVAPDESEPERMPVSEPVPDATAPQSDEQSAAVRIGKPASDLKSLGNDGVRTGRLPAVRQEGETQGALAGEAVDRSAMPPIKRFAVEVEGIENKPKMAIVLIDDGGGPVAMDMLSAFPYPLAFAVDTSREDATDKMAVYRAAGFEVLAMVALPEGAAPSDVEVAMPVLMARVPEAVAVMEAPEDGIQSDRQISDQVAQILADSGHGLLLYPKGLNTAQKLAAKNGVPSATIFRDFDSAGQKSRAIRRFLDNGALRAGSEGGVVMVGRMRPDTVSALLLWGLEDRADQIALVPVSQLLEPQN